MSASPAGSFL